MGKEEKKPLLTKNKVQVRPSLARMRTDAEYRQRWGSISIAYIVTFLQYIQNSLYWSSLFPFLTQIDETADETFFGFVTMAFNLAGAIAAPVFGWWANKIHQTRTPIIVGIITNIVGNGLLAFCEAFPTNRKWVVLVARFITGFGTGNSGALFAYIAMASTYEERNFAISIRASINSLSLLLGPAVQVAFTPIGYPGYQSGYFSLNMYTAPAFVNMLLGILQIIAVVFYFKEYWVSVREDENQVEDKSIKPYDKVAALVCIWARLACQFCLSFDQTVGSPFSMAMFKWTRQEAVLYGGLIGLSMGLIMLVGNLMVGNFLLSYLQERTTIIIGLFFFLFFYFIAFSWPGEPPMVPKESAVLLAEAAVENTTEWTYSCNYVWCSYTTRIYLAQYLIAYVSLLLGVVIAYVPNGTLFTKILGPRKQGTMQGFFAGGGLLAMTISPIVSSPVFQTYGPRALWGTGAAFQTVTIILVCATYKRLVPYTDEKTTSQAESTNSNLQEAT